MFILAQSGAAGLEAMGIEIRTIDQQMQDGTINRIGYQIVGYGFGFQIGLGEYPLEEQARAVFNDILAHMKKEDGFYDVRNEERRFVDRKG